MRIDQIELHLTIIEKIKSLSAKLFFQFLHNQYDLICMR